MVAALLRSRERRKFSVTRQRLAHTIDHILALVLFMTWLEHVRVGRQLFSWLFCTTCTKNERRP